MKNTDLIRMYFVTGKDLTNFLFKGWNTEGQTSGLIGMCAAVLFATILLEALRTLMVFLSLRNSRALGQSHSKQKMEPCKNHYNLEMEDVSETQSANRLATHALLSLLQFFSMGLAYILMLAVMTFNVWIGISVLIGTFFGYFFFGALRDHILCDRGKQTPENKPKEVLSRSNVAYSGSSSDIHM
ncbi:uncharacterized protein LOC135480510 isoform X2 [Liolophura sinensis]|uniref:uncharacterized protein LOC135480510 isoform X2 n=1 Tax=Liolophura sinensis TaxID=3198878 RepID=UPI0031597D02